MAKGKEPALPPAGIIVQIQTPDLPLFCVKANTVNPHGARGLVIQLVANRPDSSHEQQVSVGGGREFSLLFRPTRGTHEVFR